MRVRLDLAYLGTSFEGWQAQEGERAARTVQGEVETALAGLLGGPVSVHGAGRTDAGVHAEGQVAHFDVPEGAPEIPLPGLVRALNGRLAEDVRVTGASEVPAAWHARFSATGKIYRYRLRRGELLPPHAGLVEALAKEPLDVAAMRAAARLLVGRRDFGPFSITGSDPKTTVRTLRSLDVEEEGPVLVVTAIGDGFLRGMVRRLVGTLRDAGRGRIGPEEALERPGPTAEARGLTLLRVLYDAVE
ncbi:MAG TPA: tRNA pseudouridine(38-40) synthase TruA [Thermoanaerobaculia bacterium]|nr:tRNA pseudouridine(38-40) synthase TruA [Thermoanaerobaculia bacterium]